MEIERVCLDCKKVFILPRPKYKPNAKYCSRLCCSRGVAKSSAKKRGDLQRGKIKSTGRGYTSLYGVRMHRVLVEELLGRKLVEGEVVHHIDGNHKNNHISNLQLMTSSEHSKLHHTKFSGCMANNCGRKHRTKGYCSKHYKQIWRHGVIIYK
jgi:hypothetical protein